MVNVLKKDYEEAVKWYKKTVKNGNIPAKENISNLLDLI